MTCDVAVVGAGFGGLSSAILLARLGLKVTLIEGRPQIGGCLRSYRREGIDCPVGVHYFGSAAPGELLGDFIDLLGIRPDLKLRRLGSTGVIDRYLFDDETFDLPDTAEKFEAALRARFRDSPEAVAFVMHVCRAAMRCLSTDATAPMQLALPVTRTAAEVLAEQRIPGRLVEILGLQGFLIGQSLSDCPASFLMVATASLMMSAWELGCTGTDMATAMLDRAREGGVEVIVGDPAVAIEVESRRAAGVRLHSGAVIGCRTVVAAAHPKAVAAMVPEDALPASYRHGIASLEETGGMLCTVALVDESKHPARDYNVVRVLADPSHSLAGVYAQIRASGKNGKSRVTILTGSNYDDWAPWHGTRTGNRGPAYLSTKLERAERALADLASAIGTVDRSSIIDVWTPLSMRDWAGAPRGSTYGARHSIRDGMDYLVLSRPPLPGLLLVGQNAIAPGLLGTSMSVLRALTIIAGRQAVAELLARNRGMRTGDAA